MNTPSENVFQRVNHSKRKHKENKNYQTLLNGKNIFIEQLDNNYGDGLYLIKLIKYLKM